MSNTAIEAISHPEEMTARVVLELGPGRRLTASARATPAGLIAVGVLVSAVLLSAAVLARVGRSSGPAHPAPRS